MEKIIFPLIFSFLFLVSCQTPTPQCPDLDYSQCPEVETKIETKTEIKTVTTYVCSDLREVTNKLDCLKVDSEGWYEVTSFTGSNARKTDSFKINSNKWRYTASCSSGTGFNLIVYDINNPGGMYVDTVLLGQCGKTEPNYVYSGSGEFYFDMGAVNIGSWTIKVEAQK
ncbi:hypothetical protein HYU08_00140 [Candidatus Woesearchaeota archaeon]|nr:hypothetical protein [Candidatus Woesearchaeota archaeon]